jgi:hypothetical protein
VNVQSDVKVTYISMVLVEQKRAKCTAPYRASWLLNSTLIYLPGRMQKSRIYCTQQNIFA